MDRGHAVRYTVLVSLIGKIARAAPGALLLVSLLADSSAAARSRASRRLFVPVLIYHHVKLDRSGDDAIELGLTISPGQFRGELDYLRSHGFHTISALYLAEALRGARALPSHPVVLTFDDGYADMWTNVYPLLRAHHMTATFFIPSGLVGGKRYLAWNQVITMHRHGMDIEAHSVSHPDLTAVPVAQTWGEIDDSRRVLQERLRAPVRIFAYPYGTYNTLVLSDVRKAGYWAAFTTHQGWWQQSSQMLTLPRVYVDRDDTLGIFAGRLRGEAAVLAEEPS